MRRTDTPLAHVGRHLVIQKHAMQAETAERSFWPKSLGYVGACNMGGFRSFKLFLHFNTLRCRNVAKKSFVWKCFLHLRPIPQLVKL